MSKSSTSPTKPLNVGIIAVPWSVNGVVAHVQEVVPRLQERGHKVTLITAAGYPRIAETDTIKTYRCLSFPKKLYGFMPSALWDIFAILKDCDVVNAYGYQFFLSDYLTVTRFLHKKPLVITLAGSLSPLAGSGTYKLCRLHNIFLLRFQRFVDRFIAVSWAEKNEAVSQGIAKEKIEVIYSAASKDYLHLERNNLDTREKKVLYLGRLAYSKNVNLLIEAMKYVTERDSSIKLILAGPNFFGEGEILEALVSKLNLESCVEFAGEVTEKKKAELFTSCHAFVHPSLTDIFALTILEASMAGLPVIAFNLGGNPEMIVDGKTGILVNPSNPEALASAILTVLNTEGLAQKMGDEAQKYVSTKFSWEEVAKELEGVYYQALKAKRE